MLPDNEMLVESICRKSMTLCFVQTAVYLRVIKNIMVINNH